MIEKYKHVFIIALTGVFLLVFGILFFFLVFRAGSVFAAIHKLVHILTPFLYGMAIAYCLRPICNKYEHWIDLLHEKFSPGKPSGGKVTSMCAIGLSFITAFLILFILLSSVIPQVTKSLLRLSYAVPNYVQAVEEWISRMLEDYPVVSNLFGTSVDSIMTAVQDWTKTTLIPGLRNMMGDFSSGIFNVLNVLSNLLIGIIAAVYMLANRHVFTAQGKLILYSIFKPSVAQWIEHELKYADRMFVGFLGGKIVDSTIIGIICFIGCSLMNIPNTLLASVIVGVTNIIPFFGPYIGLVPSALIILISSPVKCLWFVIFILLLQQVDGNILGPRILGNSTGLSGFWVLFSIILFGGIFGFLGMIIGVPLFAVIYDMVKRAIHYALEKRGMRELLEDYERRFPGKPEKTPKKEGTWLKRLIHARISSRQANTEKEN